MLLDPVLRASVWKLAAARLVGFRTPLAGGIDMRSSSHLQLISSSAFLVFGLGSCANDPSEETAQITQALYSARHSVTIPAYFQKDSTSLPDWEKLAQWSSGNSDDESPIGYIIVNAGRDWGGTDTGHPRNTGGLVLGGPGDSNNPSAASAFVQQRIYDVGYAGTVTFGYVDFYFQRPQNEVEDDIRAWRNNYNVQGIFFDDAGRLDSSNQGGIGGARYYANFVRQQFASAGFGAGAVMFNYGGVYNYLEGFVYCIRADSPTWPAVYFVTAETDEFHYFNDDATSNLVATYNNVSLQAWLYQYWPGRFLHIIHHENPSGVNLGGILTTSAARNAEHIYITDLPNPNDPADPANPYKYLNGHNTSPQFRLFGDQASQAKTPQNYPYPGSNFFYDESPRAWGGTCPAPTPNEGGVGT
jgi:hypothetical protein